MIISTQHIFIIFFCGEGWGMGKEKEGRGWEEKGGGRRETWIGYLPILIPTGG